MPVIYNAEPVTTHWVHQLVSKKQPLQLGEKPVQLVENCYRYLHQKLNTAEQPIYGINTGFGSLYNKVIDKNRLQQLQENLVKSHACGMGDLVPIEVVRQMMVLKIINMSLGHSGVKIQTVQLLTQLYNQDIIPVIYQQGSLGASGDLAPLAHLTLPLIGLGEVYVNGERKPAAEVMKAKGIAPITLDAKEGLALLNGTEFMCAYGVEMVEQAKQLFALANLIASLSLEAFDGRPEPFIEQVHRIRPHEGQLKTAEQILAHLKGSERIQRKKEHVQDPYSFRCIPQVHGASYDAILYAEKVLNTEINSVSDNPTIFPADDLIVSAGNFHGQPLALALDFLAIALAEIGSIAERRTYKLISGSRQLPPFLVKEAGINSGFMIPQYTAASIVSQNKQLCSPASIDTIDSSNGQEDHVSMGANAATKALRVFDNLQKVVAIELLNTAQAADFREGKSSPVLEALRSEYRKHVPFIVQDVVIHDLIVRSMNFLGIS